MLKSDYKDDLFSGFRKYTMTNNEDGTVSLLDVTEYTQEGDQFGANDMNATNEEVNRMGNSVVVNLLASKWSESIPFTQAVAIPGMKATDKVGIHLHAPKDLAADVAKLRQKLTPMITDGESGEGIMTFYCGVKKPTADFQVLLTGVSRQGGV